MCSLSDKETQMRFKAGDFPRSMLYYLTYFCSIYSTWYFVCSRYKSDGCFSPENLPGAKRSEAVETQCLCQWDLCNGGGMGSSSSRIYFVAFGSVFCFLAKMRSSKF